MGLRACPVFHERLYRAHVRLRTPQNPAGRNKLQLSLGLTSNAIGKGQLIIKTVKLTLLYPVPDTVLIACNSFRK